MFGKIRQPSLQDSDLLVVLAELAVDDRCLLCVPRRRHPTQEVSFGGSDGEVAELERVLEAAVSLELLDGFDRLQVVDSVDHPGLKLLCPLSSAGESVIDHFRGPLVVFGPLFLWCEGWAARLGEFPLGAPLAQPRERFRPHSRSISDGEDLHWGGERALVADRNGLRQVRRQVPDPFSVDVHSDSVRVGRIFRLADKDGVLLEVPLLPRPSTSEQCCDAVP